MNVFLRFPIFLVQYYGDIVYKNRMVCIFESSTHENEKEVAEMLDLRLIFIEELCIFIATY